jgi:tRNA(Ile)-lysidine synthase
MNSIEKTIFELSQNLQPPIIFVAVSGGVDSMLLLDLTSNYFRVEALHVNYKLRGKDSDEDQEFIQIFCAKKQIPIHLLEIELKEDLKNSKGNLQNRAREVRYNFFREKLKENPNSMLFVGHHADDQIETFFLHYFRNSGIAGLSGMREKSGRIYRPFLKFSKNQLIEAAHERELSWREDCSNQKNDYLRNRFRNDIIPELEREIPEIRGSVIQLTQVFRLNQQILEQEVEYFIDSLKISKVLKIDDVKFFGDEKWIEFLRQLEIPFGYMSEIKKLISAKKGAKLLFQDNKFLETIVRENYYLFFVFKDNSEENVPTFKSSFIEELPERFVKSEIYLDFHLIDGSLKIRKWQKGDRIYPIGMKGSKLISDVLTDAKTPHFLRENQWVLTDSSKIISCIGICIDRRAKATKQSTKILKIEIVN